MKCMIESNPSDEKLVFIKEQLKLLYVVPRRRRYSCDMLGLGTMWQNSRLQLPTIQFYRMVFQLYPLLGGESSRQVRLMLISPIIKLLLTTWRLSSRRWTLQMWQTYAMYVQTVQYSLIIYQNVIVTLKTQCTSSYNDIHVI